VVAFGSGVNEHVDELSILANFYMALRAAEPAYTFRLGDLPKLDLQVDRGTDFKSQWSAYFSLSGLDKQPAAKQVQALPLDVSHETVTIIYNLGLTDAQRTNVDQTITTIEAYVQGTDQRDSRKAQLSSKSTTRR